LFHGQIISGAAPNQWNGHSKSGIGPSHDLLLVTGQTIEGGSDLPGLNVAIDEIFE
jgi:hypothetical protein